MKIKSFFTMVTWTITMLSIDFNEFLSDTSAIERDGTAYDFYNKLKNIGGACIIIILLLIATFICIAYMMKYFIEVVLNLNNTAKLLKAKRNIKCLLLLIVIIGFLCLTRSLLSF